MNINTFLSEILVLNSFTKEILEKTFIGVNTLYMVGTSHGNIGTILAEAQKAAYVVTIGYTVNASWLIPRGYIVLLSTTEELKEMFEDFSFFKPYNRIFLMCPTCHQGQVDFVARNARYHALEITTFTRPSNSNKVSLERKVVKILYFNFYPFVGSNKLGQLYGLDVNIVSLVLSNWSIEYVKINETKWSALMRAVDNGLGNFSITAHWLNQATDEGFEVSYPYVGTSSTFLVPRPTVKPFALALLQTLTATVWLLVLLSIIIFSSFTYLASQVQGVQNYTYMHFLLEVTCILTLNSQQGVYHSKLLKVIFLAWSLYAVILGVSYSAPLVALQANPALENSINTFQDLCNYNVVCYVNNLFLKFVLSNSYNDYQKQYSNYIRQIDGNYLSKRQSYATDVWFNKYLSKQHLPHIPSKYYQLLKESYQHVYLVFVFPKNSPFTKMFKYQMISLTESGLVKVWMDNMFLENMTNIHHHSAFFNHILVYKIRKITVKDMSVALYVLVLGSALSWISFAIESLWQRRIL